MAEDEAFALVVVRKVVTYTFESEVYVVVSVTQMSVVSVGVEPFA